MAASQYEVLKCEDCAKKLGYIYINVKIFPPRTYIRLVAGGPLERVEKTVLCEECFQKRIEANKTKQQ